LTLLCASKRCRRYVRVVGASPSRGLIAEGRRAWRANSHGVCALLGLHDGARPGFPAEISGSRAVDAGGVGVQIFSQVAGVCAHWIALARKPVLDW